MGGDEPEAWKTFVYRLIRQIPLGAVVSSDAFPDLDENIISWIAAKLEDQMLTAAYHVLKKISLHRHQPTVKEAVEDYVGGTYMIDTYYRRFYYYLDRVGMDADMEKTRDLVENMYTNRYLTDLSYKWNQLLTDDAYAAYPEVRQEDFFDHYVRPFMDEARGGRVIVIVSDGMHCGNSMAERQKILQSVVPRSDRSARGRAEVGQ